MGLKYPVEEGLALVENTANAKFDETVDIAIRLGVDPKQSDQMVRGAVSLPHGTGKTVRIVVFAEGDAARTALAAGADVVGGDELIDKIQRESWTDFDKAISTRNLMAKVGRLGKVLGPRGLMPNPKTGTVTDDTAKAVQEVKAGRVEFKLDKNGNIAVPVGKFSFSEDALVANADVVLDAVAKSRPPTAKGVFIESVTIAATVTPGIPLDISNLSKN
jgi:large subunit ribosomal protein L1